MTPDESAVYKIPPQALEAEQSVLGSILLDNQALAVVLEILSEEDFYRDGHTLIFSAMVDLFERGEPIDLITLTEWLRKKNQLEQIGGATYLSTLADNVVTTANVNHYARLVYEKALLRRLIRKSSEITSRVYDHMGDVEDLLDEAEQAIFDVSGSRKRQSVHLLRDVLKDNFKTLDKLYQRQERIIGVPSGYKKLDELTAGFQKGELIIIAGRPSMGKTALALNIARNAAIKGAVSTVIFSLEMSKEQLANRMLCSEAEVDGGNLRRGFIRQDEWTHLVEAAGKLADCPIYIDDTPAISVLEMRAKCRRIKADGELGLVIVDYLQLMRSRSLLSGSRTDNREQEISEISRSLKALAKELNIPVIALSQLNRRVEDRKPPIPQLADLRESGAIEQDADVIAFVYRDEVYNKDTQKPNTAEIIVGKQRNGPIGTVDLIFRSQFTRFDDKSYEES
jgi:replicative DNA helicase